MRENIGLGASERPIMECLWEHSPRTIVEVWHALEERTGWSKSTVNTLLGRMAAKGLVSITEGPKSKLYSPAVSREEANLSETRSLLSRAYNGSVGLMMSTLLEREALTKKDIEELYEILKRAEEAAK